MTDSRESRRSAIANPMRARQESDIRHQEKFDRDSPLSRINSRLGAEASHTSNAPSRGREARRRRLAADFAARPSNRGDEQKTTSFTQRSACVRDDGGHVAATAARSGEGRQRPLQPAIAERRAECERVR
jgi:hypothetical protein